MPTYEYRCDACNDRFEKFQSISAEPVRDCPQCGAENAVKRLISGGAGLIFKGSGFYTTDYRSASYKEAAKKDGSSPPPSAPATSSSDSTSSTPPASSAKSSE